MKRQLLLVVFFCAACRPANHTSKALMQKERTTRHIAHQTKTDDYLEYDSVKVNDVLPLQAKIEAVVNVLGTPDSIVKPDPAPDIAYRDVVPYYCYYKGLFFEKYQDTLIFRSIDFRQNKALYLRAGKLCLNAATTLDDFRRWFPSAYENNGLSGTDMDIRQSYSLNVHKAEDKDRWILTFNNSGRLITFEYWIDN